MKRNILGVAVFTFIITLAIVIKSAFFEAVPNNVEPVIQPVIKTSCWRMKQTVPREYYLENSGETKLAVKQAVLNLNTKQINWGMTVPHDNSLFVLHFFVKDNLGTRYLATEEGPSLVMNNNDKSENLSFVSSYLWLDNLKFYQNLYVVPEQVSFTEYHSKNYRPKFDENLASPILLYSPSRSAKTIFLRK